MFKRVSIHIFTVWKLFQVVPLNYPFKCINYSVFKFQKSLFIFSKRVHPNAYLQSFILFLQVGRLWFNFKFMYSQNFKTQSFSKGYFSLLPLFKVSLLHLFVRINWQVALNALKCFKFISIGFHSKLFSTSCTV